MALAGVPPFLGLSLARQPELLGSLSLGRAVLLGQNPETLSLFFAFKPETLGPLSCSIPSFFGRALPPFLSLDPEPFRLILARQTPFLGPLLRRHRGRAHDEHAWGQGLQRRNRGRCRRRLALGGCGT
mgnify:CR=1 FL=1